MKDHYTWQPVWYRSEYHERAEYERGQRRHALAAFYGLLTAVGCAAALIYMFG